MLFRSDNEGVEKLHRFIEFIFLYTRTCYQIAPVFGLDLEEVVVDEISLVERNNQLQELLEQVSEVLENDDIISLADILEYEIKPVMENLHLYINSLTESMNQSL